MSSRGIQTLAGQLAQGVGNGLAVAISVSSESLSANSAPFFAGAMAFATSFAVNFLPSQVFRRMLNAAVTAAASSSPPSPTRINSVQSTLVPSRAAAYSIDHPTIRHQTLNRVFGS